MVQPTVRHRAAGYFPESLLSDGNGLSLLFPASRRISVVDLFLKAAPAAVICCGSAACSCHGAVVCCHFHYTHTLARKDSLTLSRVKKEMFPQVVCKVPICNSISDHRQKPNEDRKHGSRLLHSL